jgi:Fe-S oxidoreductase
MKRFLDWSDYENAGMGDAYADIPKYGGDFAKAVAVCINSRQCEDKGKKGVMCPSFRVTDDPALSTGGRVRMLKAALNSDDPARAFDDAELARAMGLCVACKGCKRECENEVDMAMIKLEYMAQRNQRHGASARARLFAELPRWLHDRPWMRGLPALLNRMGALGRPARRLFGLADFPLPEPARAGTLPAQPPADPDKARAGEVVLFVDTFSREFEPGLVESALRLLDAAGYGVELVGDGANTGTNKERPLCCGRTWLGQGMVDQARAEAQRVLAALQPHLEAGKTVIGLEPSCLLTFRDEYRFLDLGEQAGALAERALLLEEFLARELQAKRLKLEWRLPEGELPPILIHGHCHQKAVGAMRSVRKLLKSVKGLKFEFIDASCCGMAGSFGLEAEHREMAQKMADQALMPALQAAPDAQVVANGFSCRHQIRGQGDTRPVHLVELLASLLTTDPG